MKKILLIIFVLAMEQAPAQPIMLHPENPHYFKYKGEPAVLITSAMHYGAVLNQDIDYDKYLETLKIHGFNLHREFIISCYEWLSANDWASEQTPLSPRPGKLISPYSRSLTPGAIDGLNKFDLDKWNPAYFGRLKDFCRKADEKGIVVEIVLFTVLYSEEAWKTNPLNFSNNINNVGHGNYNDYTFIREPLLFERQQKLVTKIVQELNSFDNVYFEICNEPYWAKGIPEKNPEIKEQHFLPEVNLWQAAISKTIIDTEKTLPQKHLIAQNLANEYYKIDTLCHPSVSVLNYHYAFPPRTVPDNYHLNLPLSFDETANGCDAPDRRTEAWAFMLSGGAAYDNLDWSFAIDDQSGMGRNPVGKRRSGYEVKQQLGVLKHFMDSFDYIHSKPIEKEKILNMPQTIMYFGLENEKSTAIYFLKRNISEIHQLEMKINAGNYDLKWIDPIDGSVIRKTRVSIQTNLLSLDFPDFSDDLLLTLQKI